MELEEQENRKTNEIEYFDYQLTSEEEARYFAPRYKRGDVALDIGMIVYLIFAFLLATINETYLLATAVGGSATALYLLSKIALPTHHFKRYVGALALASYVWLYLFQVNGLFEMHIVAFIGAILLIIYQDWRIVMVYVAAILLHHIVVSYLQYAVVDAPLFSPLGSLSLKPFLMHLFLESIALGLCVAWSYHLHSNALAMFKHHAHGAKQLESIDNSISFANELAEGHLDSEFEAVVGDNLSEALAHMRESLRVAGAKENQEKFVNVGLAEVGEILRDFDDDFGETAARLVSKLVNYFDANQGGLYLCEKVSESDEHPYLDLVAFYAYKRLKYSDKHVQYGQGLLGQALQEESTIYITEVPKQFINTTSGLGEATPKALLIVPLKVNDVVHGMMELASFNELEPYQIELMEKLGESIASTIANYRNTAYTKLLLGDSQSLAEQMQGQEEEMRQNMEELQATQEELSRKEARMAEELKQVRADGVEEVKSLQARLDAIDEGSSSK